MIYAVIDTNILVSAMLNPKSVPGQIIMEAFTGKIIPVLNNSILDIVSPSEMLNIIQKDD